MDLSKSTLVFLGSSVTYGGGNWSMCDYIAETTGAQVIKWAVSGTTLCTTRPNSYVERLDAHIGTQDRCDHFVCQLSTNDAHGCPLGKVSESSNPADFDVSTVAGAIEYIIASARARWGCPVSFYTGTRMNNKVYEQMVELLLAISRKWNIGVLDLWHDPQMCAVTPEEYARYMRDSVHPTKEGYTEWWGPKFIAFLSK